MTKLTYPRAVKKAVGLMDSLRVDIFKMSDILAVLYDKDHSKTIEDLKRERTKYLKLTRMI